MLNAKNLLNMMMAKKDGAEIVYFKPDYPLTRNGCNVTIVQACKVPTKPSVDTFATTAGIKTGDVMPTTCVVANLIAYFYGFYGEMNSDDAMAHVRGYISGELDGIPESTLRVLDMYP